MMWFTKYFKKWHGQDAFIDLSYLRTTWQNYHTLSILYMTKFGKNNLYKLCRKIKVTSTWWKWVAMEFVRQQIHWLCKRRTLIDKTLAGHVKSDFSYKSQNFDGMSRSSNGPSGPFRALKGQIGPFRAYKIIDGRVNRHILEDFRRVNNSNYGSHKTRLSRVWMYKYESCTISESSRSDS